MSILDQVEKLLPRCRPWSLDQLDRSLWRLAGRGLFETWALLGCWIVDTERYCVVLRRGDDTVGLIGGPDGLPMPSAQRLAEWRAQNWTRTGMVWSADPAALTLPWADRPPRPGDSRQRPAGIIAWDDSNHVPPSRDATVEDRAIMALHRRVVHPMWAETAGIRYLTVYGMGLQLRSSLRLAAFWVTAPDGFAVIETHIWPPDDIEPNTALLVSARLPGQQHLRFGQYLGPNPLYSWSWHIDDLQFQKELDAVYEYPAGALTKRTLAHGVAWEGELPGPGGVRMAQHLHSVLDR
ncbi:hypothetical protein [Microlunatus sp. Y2014]|uniref:hypothetical protein n=1 Tax=Microlunatus sp. Y2014 TaxID=3418488 RepID=UPI003DA6D779